MPKGFVSFAEVKARVDFVALLDRYDLLESLTQKGDSLAGPCPLCGATGKRPFTVNLTKRAWYCFAKCSAGGNVLDFVSRKEGVEIRRAAELLDSWFELGLQDAPAETRETRGKEPKKTEKEKPAPAREKPNKNTPLTFALKQLDPAHDGFAAYGVGEETARFFEAGFCARGLLRDRLAVPIHSRDGALLAYAGIDPDPTAVARYLFPPNFNPDLEVFNLHRAGSSSSETVFLAAEIADVLYLHENGVPGALGLLTATLSETQEELLRSSFPQDSRLLALSRGAALEEVALRLARHFAVRIVDFAEFAASLDRAA